MDYPVKTLSQLRPILQGFRKAAGLTQVMMASHLGVTQQTYAQLEANPAAVSVQRLFRVLRVLDVDLTLIQTALHPRKSGGPDTITQPAPDSMPAATRIAGARKAKTGSAVAAGHAKRTTPTSRKKESAPTPSRVRSTARQADAAPPRKGQDNSASEARRSARKTAGISKKRDDL